MIELRDIKKSYKVGKIRIPVLRGISLSISKGEFVAIMGPSGSGKTTLMNILGCLDNPDCGTYTLEGIIINQLRDDKLTQIRNQKIGFVFQNYNLLPRTDAIRNVELPMIYGNIINHRARARSALSIVGLEERIHHKPNELSGGQQQRAAIARALVNKPSIILADEPTGNLDSQSEKEIMEILRDLNRKGVTIIMVTHDSNIAQYANRVIHLMDGQIIKDEQIENNTIEHEGKLIPEDNPSLLFEKIPTMTEESKHIKHFLEEPLPTNKKISFFKMRENIRMGLFCLLSNKMRTLLTMLGLVIGVSSLISMISIGQGAYRQATKIIRDIGPNLIFVQKERGSKIKFFMSDAEAISEMCPSLETVLPVFEKKLKASYKGKHSDNVTIHGTLPAWPYVRNQPVVMGEMFTDDDVLHANKVAVIGDTVVEKLFGGSNPLGEFITVKNTKLKVIGVYEKKQRFGLRDRNNKIVLPLTTAQKRIFGTKELTQISLVAVDPERIKSAVKEIESVMEEKHNIPPGEKSGFEILSQDLYIDLAKKQTQIFTNLLGIIAAISLIVGGVGIMNIMLVSVTERTREIGVRKALGAKRRDILGQIIMETLVMCIGGGVMGVFIGIISTHIINKLTKWVTLITLNSIMLAFIFACVVGLLSGIYPALKASRLNPIEALRYE